MPSEKLASLQRGARLRIGDGAQQRGRAVFFADLAHHITEAAALFIVRIKKVQLIAVIIGDVGERHRKLAHGLAAVKLMKKIEAGAINVHCDVGRPLHRFGPVKASAAFRFAVADAEADGSPDFAVLAGAARDFLTHF